MFPSGVASGKMAIFSEDGGLSSSTLGGEGGARANDGGACELDVAGGEDDDAIVLER